MTKESNTVASRLDLDQSFAIWEKQPKPKTDFPPSLLNVGIAYNAIENFGYVPERHIKYIEANSRTQAFEAVAPGVEMRTYQAWDEKQKQLVAYGFPTSEIYEAGLADVIRLRQVYGDKASFEEKRRRIELTDSKLLNSAVEVGLMDTHQKIVISPYPVGADQNTAKEIGYFADKGIAMVRTFNYNPDTKLMKVDQIALEHTDLKALTTMISLFEGQEITESLESSEILSRQIYIPKAKLGNGVVDIARIYDRILENTHGERFFLGERIGDKQRDYQGISAKTAKAETQTAKIIDHIVDTNIEVAKSLRIGVPTKALEPTINIALQNSNSEANLISQSDRRYLTQALFGKFDINSANALIEFVTKNNYLAMLCITNPERAKQVFGSQDVEQFQKNYLNNPSLSAVVAPPVLPGKTLELYFCGSMMQMGSSIGQPMSNMSIPVFAGFLRQDAGDGKGPLDFQCQAGHWNRRPYNGTIPNCTTCGASVGC